MKRRADYEVAEFDEGMVYNKKQVKGQSLSEQVAEKLSVQSKEPKFKYIKLPEEYPDYKPPNQIDEVKEILPIPFFGAIVGPTDSGKTYLAKRFFNMPEIWHKKFNLYLSITPYHIEGITSKMPEYNLESWNIQKLKEKLSIINKALSTRKKILICGDDSAAGLYAVRGKTDTLEFFFNRRNEWPNLEISILIISQTYKNIPTCVRRNLDWAIIKDLHGDELTSVEQDFFPKNGSAKLRIQAHFAANVGRYPFAIIHKKFRRVFLNLSDSFSI